MDKATNTTGLGTGSQISKAEMDKAVKTGTVIEGQIDKTEMDEAVKTNGTVIDGQINKTEDCPRKHQAESHGSGPSRSVSDTIDETFLLDDDDDDDMMMSGATCRYSLDRR